MGAITGIGHIALKVHDLERSLAFYRDRLGFPEMMRIDRPEGGIWLVYLRITDEQFIEIFPGAENERAPGWNGNAITHVCLTVDDLDAVVDRVVGAGIPLLIEKKTAIDGNRQAWIEDPDGNRIEFMQINPDSMQMQAIARLRAAGA
jgi:lactoylglutathione lyase